MPGKTGRQGLDVGLEGETASQWKPALEPAAPTPPYKGLEHHVGPRCLLLLVRVGRPPAEPSQALSGW